MAESKSLKFSGGITYVKTYNINSSTKTTYSTESTKTFGYKYSDGTDIRVDKILYIPPYDVPDILLNATTKFASLTLSTSVSAANGNTHTEFFNIRAVTSQVSGNAETIYKQLSDISGYLEMFQPSINGTTSVSIPENVPVTDSEDISNALKYGVVIRCTERVTSPDRQAYFSISNISLKVKYYSPESPPNVVITTPPEAVYLAHTAITDAFDIAWQYIQPAGTPQSGFDLMYCFTPSDHYTPEVMREAVLSQQTAYSIQPEDWCVPLSKEGWGKNYNRRIVVWVRAYIKNNSIAGEFTGDPVDDSAKIWEVYFPHPYDLSPGGNAIIISTDITRLSWKIKFDCEEEGFYVTNDPTNFDVEYSANGGESWTKLLSNAVVFRDGDLYYYDVPANTFPSGIIRWRIRAYVNDKTLDLYENEIVSSKVQASTSSVICDENPLPTISWSSVAQVAFQVRFSDYDSGTRYGSQTSFTIPHIYADGYYPVQVRTQVSDGTWSEWTEPEYVQIVNKPQSNVIALTALVTRHAVVLDWTDSKTADNYIVYRNRIPIYVGNEKNYTDVGANGMCTYYIRAMKGANYAQSNTVSLDASPAVDCLYDITAMRWIPLKFSLQERSRMYVNSIDVIYKKYAGRSKPIMFTSGFTNRQMSGEYAFKTRDEALQLANAVGHTVIFKDTCGGVIIGTLNNPNMVVLKKLYSVSFNVIETDFKEEVEYDTAGK